MKYIFLYNILIELKVPDIYYSKLPEPTAWGSDSKTKREGNLLSSFVSSLINITSVQ